MNQRDSLDVFTRICLTGEKWLISYYICICSEGVQLVILVANVSDCVDRVEALICLIAYTAYGLVMAFNRRLEAAFKAITGIQDLDDPVETKEAPCK